VAGESRGRNRGRSVGPYSDWAPAGKQKTQNLERALQCDSQSGS
jgi:hypothetical protein